MLEKSSFIDRTEVDEIGTVIVRTKINIMEDGVQISTTFHRHVVAPGDDYSNEDPKVRAICAAVHTEEVVAAYRAMFEKQV